jgi:replicative DNA helicase
MNETPKNPSPEGGKPVAPLLRFADALGELRADADANHAAKTSGTLRGPITGLPRLDKEISHALAPGLHGVYGNAGAGKTAFAMQVAATCGFPALYVTCEMAPSELLRRHTARATQTYLGRLKSGEMTGADVEALAKRALAASPDFCLLDATRAPAPPAHLLKTAQIAKGDAPHVLIVIDSLQSWAETVAPEGTGSEYETLNTGIMTLRQIAHTLRAPILFISERNRKSMESGGLNAGAGSRKIEYGAETVFDLDRNMEAQPNGAGEFEIMLRIAKNRHGSVGTAIPLLFNGALQLFTENTNPARGKGKGAA